MTTALAQYRAELDETLAEETDLLADIMDGKIKLPSAPPKKHISTIRREVAALQLEQAQRDIERAAEIERKRPTFAEVLTATSELFDIPAETLMSRSRVRPVVKARSIMFVAMKGTNTEKDGWPKTIEPATLLSFPELARLTNRGNHSTIVTAVMRTSQAIERGDVYLDNTVEALVRKIQKRASELAAMRGAK